MSGSGAAYEYGENVTDSAIFATISGLVMHFRHFYGLQTQIDTLRVGQEPRCLRNDSRRAQPIWSIPQSLGHEPPAARRSSEESLRKEKLGNGEDSPMTGFDRQEFRT
jgi:hypothetical protein